MNIFNILLFIMLLFNVNSMKPRVYIRIPQYYTNVYVNNDTEDFSFYNHDSDVNFIYKHDNSCLVFTDVETTVLLDSDRNFYTTELSSFYDKWQKEGLPKVRELIELSELRKNTDPKTNPELIRNIESKFEEETLKDNNTLHLIDFQSVIPYNIVNTNIHVSYDYIQHNSSNLELMYDMFNENSLFLLDINEKNDLRLLFVKANSAVEPVMNGVNFYHGNEKNIIEKDSIHNYLNTIIEETATNSLFIINSILNNNYIQLK